MPIFIDQTGRSVEVIENPKRIVSLVPSQSEYLWDIGIKSELVGITRFCIHPEEMFRTVERIGGTKSLNLEKIRALTPDLIIGNKEENEKNQIEELQHEFPVWMSDINTLEDALEMMREIGALTGKQISANRVLREVEDGLERIKLIFNGERFFYFIWKNPFMVAASNTFIDSLISHMGLSNCASHMKRYPEITLDEIKNTNPDFCFLSTEPYPFKAKDVEAFKKILPATKVILADGEMFSWYGSRLRGLPEYLEKLKEELNN